MVVIVVFAFVAVVDSVDSEFVGHKQPCNKETVAKLTMVD